MSWCCKYCHREHRDACIFSNYIMVLSGYMPRSGIAGSYGSSIFFFFWGIAILFSIVAAPVYIPISSVGGFPFLHTLSGTYCRLNNDGCSDQCEAGTSLWFWFAFSLIISNSNSLFLIEKKNLRPPKKECSSGSKVFRGKVNVLVTQLCDSLQPHGL